MQTEERKLIASLTCQVASLTAELQESMENSVELEKRLSKSREQTIKALGLAEELRDMVREKFSIGPL